MTELIQRVVGLFIVGLIPLSVFFPLLENMETQKLARVLGLFLLVWLVYANAWCKKAVSIFNSESIKWIAAYSKGRVFLNTDIMTKLAFLPVIGFLFDNWIHRNDPTHGDDREIKTSEEK